MRVDSREDQHWTNRHHPHLTTKTNYPVIVRRAHGKVSTCALSAIQHLKGIILLSTVRNMESVRRNGQFEDIRDDLKSTRDVQRMRTSDAYVRDSASQASVGRVRWPLEYLL